MYFVENAPSKRVPPICFLIFQFINKYSSPVFCLVKIFLLLVGFNDPSTFLGYLTPDLFLCKSVLFQTIQFSMSTQFNCQTFLFRTIQFIQAVLIQLIQFSISTYFVYTQLHIKKVQC